MKGAQYGAKNGSYREKLAYICGRIEVQIEGYAESMGIPKLVVAEGVAEFLQPARMGVRDNLPGAGMPRSAAQGPAPQPPRKVDEGTHSNWSRHNDSGKMNLSGVNLREALLEELRQNPARVVELTKKLGVKKNIVAYHLRAMVDGGYVRKVAAGNEWPTYHLVKNYKEAIKLVKKKIDHVAAGKSGWAGMTKAERSAEMKRRLHIGKGKGKVAA